MFFAHDVPIYGVQPQLLIVAAQHLRGDSDETPEPVSTLDVREAFGATSAEAAILIDHLVRDGFLAPKADSHDRYLPTPTLIQLSLAKLGAGMDRQTASGLLERVIAQAKAINAAQDPHECTIACIVVFGSYLDEGRQRLGDLDLGVEIEEAKIRPEADFKRGETGFFAALRAPGDRCRRRLSLRKPKQISLHNYSEVRRLNTPYQLVYGTEPDDSSI